MFLSLEGQKYRSTGESLQHEPEVVESQERDPQVLISSRRRGRRPGDGGGINRQGFLQGLVGGEQEQVDRIFTGQISGLLNGNLAGTNTNIQYGFESSCPEGVDQNTALLATAAAIGELDLQTSPISPGLMMDNRLGSLTD